MAPRSEKPAAASAAVKPARNERKYYGQNACLALWKKRPDDIQRVYLRDGSINAWRPLLKWCASRKLPYHLVGDDELAKITKSTHHEGICLLAKAPRLMSEPELLEQLSSQTQACVLYLDGVANPHNVGSLVRTAANFGIAAILGDRESLPSVSAALCRVAEGGAESVLLRGLEHSTQGLQRLIDAGFTVVCSSSRAKEQLYGRTRLPAKTVFVLGSERSGVSKQFTKLCSREIAIPATGAVESLNVSVAGALLMGEYFRQHPRS